MNSRDFRTRQDYIETLNQLCIPLEKYYSDKKALLQIGYTGTHYGSRTVGLEGFSRILWGLVPLWAGGEKNKLDKNIVEGLKNGTDPTSKEFWGNYGDTDQAYVEMASIGMSLMMTPEKTWHNLNEDEKNNLRNWLMQINTHKISDNNWLFFRILVNCGLQKVGASYDKQRLKEDLDRIDDFYLGDGWYSDGMTLQRDYYIGFAMHFYSLIYAKLMYKEDTKRCIIYIERAKLFAKDFIYWFGERGEALPYGRSLTYRFAQVSFWCAFAFAVPDTDSEKEVGDVSLGVIKGMINRHFRWWFQNPILDCEDKLTIGYTYPNLAGGEGYNSPGSPYWSFKSFIILALGEEHPFWQAKEEELPKLEFVRVLKHPQMIITRNEDGFVTALTAGQYAEWEPVHCAEKYEKFAYSSYFGFQTPRSYYNLSQASPDNMLAFYKDSYYHIRRRCKNVEIKEDKIISEWSPFSGVEVTTILIPHKKGHIRIHKIVSDSSYLAVEGGFSIPFNEIKEIKISNQGNHITLTNESVKEKHFHTDLSTNISSVKSSIEITKGNGICKSIMCEANVNIVHPRTMLPYIEYQIEKGITEISVYVEGVVCI